MQAVYRGDLGASGDTWNQATPPGMACTYHQNLITFSYPGFPFAKKKSSGVRPHGKITKARFWPVKEGKGYQESDNTVTWEHGWRVQLARCLSALSSEVKPGRTG